MDDFVVAITHTTPKRSGARWLYLSHGWLHRGRIAVTQRAENFKPHVGPLNIVMGAVAAVCLA